MLRDGMRTTMRAIGLAAAVLSSVVLSSGTALADPDFYYLISNVRAQAGSVQSKWYNFTDKTAGVGMKWELHAVTAEWPLVVTLEVTFERDFSGKEHHYALEKNSDLQVLVDGSPQGLFIPSGDPEHLKWMYAYFPRSGAHTIFITYHRPYPNEVKAEGFSSEVKIVPRIKLNW